MNITANLETNSTSMNALVSDRFKKQIGRTPILFLGKSLISNITNIPENKYDIFNFENVSDLMAHLKSWYKHNDYHPECFIIHHSFIDELLSVDFIQIKKDQGFKTVPVIVFSNQEKEEIRSLAHSFGADEYFHQSIKFASLIARIKFYKRLKSAGFSRQDAILKKDKVYKMYFLKRLFDITVASTILFLLSPVFIITAIVIKLESKGPIFYVSKRAGTNYKIFDFYKFRSMQVDADKLLEKLKETSNQYQDGNQFVKIKDDPRVTRVGNFLRNSSIDEIPQLINVLKGDMSIVGNRPLPLYEAQLLTTDDHAERFLGPAGITGLWQTLKRGKSDMSSEERIMLDRIYVRKNSLLFDFKLMLMTVPALVQSEKV